MGDIVTALIQGQSREEYKAFQKFIGGGGESDREDLKLANRIRDGYTEPDRQNVNAYRLTKKRLKKHLELFALLFNAQKNHISRINNWLEMARYLSDKNMHEPAWDYLYKAEQDAITYEEYELLGSIYYIQISYYAHRYLPENKRPDIKVLLKKYDKNEKLAKIDANSNSAFAMITSELSKRLSTGFGDDENTLVNNVLSEYDLGQEGHFSPKVFSRVTNMVCWALTEQKEYAKLKAYALGRYSEMVSMKLLDKVSPDFVMELLSIICLSLFRTKDYTQFDTFQQLYAGRLEQFRPYKDKFMIHDFRAGIMKADLCLSTNNLSGAKKSLMVLDEKYGEPKQILPIYFILRINMIATCFCEANYKICLRLFTEITRENIQKKVIERAGLGIEIVLLSEIYAAIFYYEMEEYDDAKRFLNALKRRYASILSQKARKRETLFLQIFEKMINDVDYTKSKTFKSDQANFIKLKEYVPGDKEYISLNAWLMGKLNHSDYYTSLLSLIGNVKV